MSPAACETFLEGLRAAAPAYVHTVIADASATDLRDLREIVRADDDALEDFRPWGIDLAGDMPAARFLENARAMLTARRLLPPEASSGVAEWPTAS